MSSSSSSSFSSPILPTLIDDTSCRNYMRWLKASWLAASKAWVAYDPAGLLFLCLHANQAAWNAHPLNLVPAVLASDGTVTTPPSSRPMPTITAPVTPSGNASSGVWSAYNQNQTRYHSFLQDRADFLSLLLTSIGPSNQSKIADPIYGVSAITIDVIFTEMAALYGVPLAEDIRQLKEELKVPLTSPSEFLPHYRRFCEASADLLFFKHPVSDYGLFTFFLESLRPFPVFAQQLSQFYFSYPLTTNHTLSNLIPFLTILLPYILSLSSPSVIMTAPVTQQRATSKRPKGKRVSSDPPRALAANCPDPFSPSYTPTASPSRLSRESMSPPSPDHLYCCVHGWTISHGWPPSGVYRGNPCRVIVGAMGNYPHRLRTMRSPTATEGNRNIYVPALPSNQVPLLRFPHPPPFPHITPFVPPPPRTPSVQPTLLSTPRVPQ